MLDKVAIPAVRQKRSKLAPTSCQASSMIAAGTMAADVVVSFMALLSFADSAPRAYRLKVSNACLSISTLSGATRVPDTADEIGGIDVEPVIKHAEVAETLEFLCMAAVGVCMGVNQTLGGTEGAEALDGIATRYTDLSNRTKAQNAAEPSRSRRP